MFENILNVLSKSTEKIIWTEYKFFSKRFEENVNNLKSFKERRAIWLPNDLPLITFIELLPKSKNLNEYEKIERLFSEGLPLANRVGMATVLDKADPIYYGLFTGKCKEQWIATIDGKNQHSNIKPIRCLWHPFVSLNLWMEEDVDIFSDKIAFFIVDIISLSQMINSKYKESDSFDVKKFIAKTIIPSLIEDLVTITLFNRYNELLNDKNIDDEPARLIPIWYDLIDECNDNQNKVTANLLRINKGISYLSQNTPLWENNTIFTFLQSLPPINSVKNVFPLCLTALTNYLNFLLTFNKKNKGVPEQSLLNSLRLQLAIMNNDRTLLSNDIDLRKQQEETFGILSTLI